MSGLRIYQVLTPDFDTQIGYVAAKNRDQAKFCAAKALYENYFCESIKFGICFGYVKSVKRHPALDGLIDQRRSAPRFISEKGGQGQ